MEIIPAGEESSDSNAVAPRAAALDISPAAHEPLGVESLEEKVLLASDTAAAGPAAPVETVSPEPAALVAAPVAGGAVLHGLAMTAEAVDTAALPNSSGLASPTPRESHVEVVELPHELVDRPGPEEHQPIERAADLGENESTDNEFGLATIEPEKNTSLHGHNSGKVHEPLHVSRTLTEQSIQPEPAGGEGQLADAVLDVRVLDELGRQRPAPELAASLAEETAIAPLLDELPASESPTAHPKPVDHETNFVPLPQSQSNTAVEADGVNPEDQPPAANFVDSAKDDLESLNVPTRPNAQDPTADLADEPAVHDAIFAGGGGVEAVIDRGTSDR